jgi:peptidoglycan DL-endopeptidase RipA
MRRMPGSRSGLRIGPLLSGALAIAVIAGGQPGPTVTPAPRAHAVAALAKAPSVADIERARHRAAAARIRLASLQDKAEIAVEAYHAADVAATKARALAKTKADLSAQATAASNAAASLANAARASADRARAEADEAERALVAAQQRVGAAQASFNAVAVAAYVGAGGMTQVGSVIDSHDPTEFTRRQAMVDQVGAYQKSVIDGLAVARAEQATAAVAADQAAAQAADAARVAADKADTARALADQARAAADAATKAAADAAAAAAHAAAAKRAAATAVAAQSHVVAARDTNVQALERARAAALRHAAEVRRRLAAQRREAERRARERHRSHSSSSGSSSGSAGSSSGSSSSAPVAGSPGAVAVTWAYKEIGVPYSWGGGNAEGPTYGVAQGANILGFDCSGLTLFAYAHAGIALDHYTGSQWLSGPHIAQSDLRPGDLVFFATNTGDPSTIHHVGLYIGGGQMIEAPQTGLVIRVASAFRSDYIGAVRPYASG